MESALGGQGAQPKIKFVMKVLNHTEGFVCLFVSIYIIFKIFKLKKISFFGRAVQLAGSQFPDQGLTPGHGNENSES